MSLREDLAALEHEQWMHWAKGIMRQEKISEKRLQRWNTLFVDYSTLDEKTKVDDRQWADKTIQIVCAHLKNELDVLPNFCHFPNN